MTALEVLTAVRFPADRYRELVGHARRKLTGDWEAGEEQAPKAYGLLGGRAAGPRVEVTHVVPLRRNLRDRPDLKPEVDRLMDTWAVPSETPFDRRGWVSDPREVLAAQELCDRAGSVLFGAYHMHRVSWADDPRRDRCTAIDRALAAGSGLWAVIVSMVDPARPAVRAFFEGDNAREATVEVDGPLPPGPALHEEAAP